MSDVLRAPIPGHEFVDALGGMIRQAGQQVGELAWGPMSLGLAMAMRL